LRLTVTLAGPPAIAVPVHYNYLLQAAIYAQIEQPALRKFLHEQGFLLGRRRFKLFTFSRLLGKVRFDSRGQQFIFTPPVNLVICSPVRFIVQELGNGLLRQGHLRLGETFLEVARIATDDPVVRTSPLVFRMLSPVVAYSTLQSGGRRFTYYYSPFEERFEELVAENLAKKYLLIHGRPASKDGFRIRPARVSPADQKVLDYKGTVIKGWLGSYELGGDPHLLEVALHAGLGSKNSQGFGCCEPLGEKKDGGGES